MNPKSDSEYYKRKILELTLLYNISENLKKSLDIKELLEPILKLIAANMGMLRGTLTLLNRRTGEIFIESSFGLSAVQQQKGRYRLGEGITGKVIQTGEPALVPKISEEPLFLNRTGARDYKNKKEISFICVPIKIGDQTIGALSVDRLFHESISLDEDFRLLSILCSMIAQAVQFRQNLNEERQKLIEENIMLKHKLEIHSMPLHMIGNSYAINKVYNLIKQVAKSDTTVLLRGESGTGKELVAHAIHHNSLRSLKPLIKVNCAALPETIIESELFGHVRGAFTGAISTRKGRFELANGGTIFLDEIGDLSIATQIKLLRILQEKEFERVGGNITFKTDVRIIAATNQDLERLLEAKKFREDLYYRLNVFSIFIPPLRNRRSDIILLCEHFIEKYNKLNNKNVKHISASVMSLFMRYNWPGNIRELENCIQRMVILSSDEYLYVHQLPSCIKALVMHKDFKKMPLQESLDNLEKELIINALKDSKGNMHRAAKALYITDRQMGIRIGKYKINTKDFKD